jgi:hypothetical protein
LKSIAAVGARRAQVADLKIEKIDEELDHCWKVTTDRVGPVTQSSRGHFQSLFRECLQEVTFLM